MIATYKNKETGEHVYVIDFHAKFRTYLDNGQVNEETNVLYKEKDSKSDIFVTSKKDFDKHFEKL